MRRLGRTNLCSTILDVSLARLIDGHPSFTRGTNENYF